MLKKFLFIGLAVCGMLQAHEELAQPAIVKPGIYETKNFKLLYILNKKLRGEKLDIYDKDYLAEDAPFDFFITAPLATGLLTYGVIAAAQYAPVTLPIIAVGAFLKNMIQSSARL
jgi:hypothetical protein